MGRAEAPTAKSVVRVREFSDLGLNQQHAWPGQFNRSDSACQTGYLIEPDKFSLMATAARRLSEAYRDDLIFRKSGSLYPSGILQGRWRCTSISGQNC
jgi:hypothetical protein